MPCQTTTATTASSTATATSQPQPQLNSPSLNARILHNQKEELLANCALGRRAFYERRENMGQDIKQESYKECFFCSGFGAPKFRQHQCLGDFDLILHRLPTRERCLKHTGSLEA